MQNNNITHPKCAITDKMCQNAYIFQQYAKYSTICNMPATFRIKFARNTVSKACRHTSQSSGSAQGLLKDQLQWASKTLHRKLGKA